MTGEPYCTWGHRLVERVPLVTAEEAPLGIHGHAAQARWPSPGLGFFGPIQARYDKISLLLLAHYTIRI